MNQKPDVSSPERKLCLVVLGAPRSGGSACVGMASQLGCSLPDTLYLSAQEAGAQNYEAASIRSLNDDILKSAGSSWDDLSRFYEGWLKSPVARDFHARALKVLEAEFGTTTFFVLKDPRLCRLLPFWLEVLEAFGCDVRPVMHLRQPKEVARSLQAQQGIDLARGQLIWLRSQLEAERASRGLTRVCTSFDALLSNWAVVANRLQEKLGFSWPRLIEFSDDSVSSVLSADLRHHRATTAQTLDDPLVNSWIRDVLKIFDHWAERDERTSDHKVLDRISTELDAATLGLRTVLTAAEKRNKAVGEERDVLTRKYKSVRSENEKVQAELRASAQIRKEAQKKIADNDATIKALQTQVGQAKQVELHLLQAQTELEQKETKLVSLQAEVTQAQASAQDAIQNAEASAEQVKTQEEQLKELQALQHQTESALRQREHETQQSAERIAELEAIVSGFDVTLAEKQAEGAAKAEALQADIDERFRELGVLGSMVQEHAKEREKLASALSSAKRNLREVRETSSELQAQRDFLRDEVTQLRISTSWKITAPLRRILSALRGS